MAAAAGAGAGAAAPPQHIQHNPKWLRPGCYDLSTAVRKPIPVYTPALDGPLPERRPATVVATAVTATPAAPKPEPKPARAATICWAPPPDGVTVITYQGTRITLKSRGDTAGAELKLAVTILNDMKQGKKPLTVQLCTYHDSVLAQLMSRRFRERGFTAQTVDACGDCAKKPPLQSPLKTLPR